MKIAILSLYSGHVNRGVETWARDFGNKMSKNHTLTLFQGGRKSTDNNFKTKVIPVKIFWKLRGGENLIYQTITSPYWFALNIYFTLRVIFPLIKFKPDIVMPTNGGAQTLIVKLLCKIFGWKLVIVGHAGIGAPDKWNLLCRPDLFISPSARGARWAKTLPFARGVKIIHIPHGVNIGRFAVAHARKIDLKKPIILCVSSFDPYKRVELAVWAVSKLNSGSLLVIGGDRSQGEIDELAADLLGKDRYLKLQVDNSEIPEYYKSVELFTLPSDENEAFGIVYLEALASNLPVVATDDELRKEIIGGAGILVDPKNIESYKDALEAALNKKWGDVPRKQAEKFSWDIICDKYNYEFNLIMH